jgi:hypothetical protein
MAQRFLAVPVRDNKRPAAPRTDLGMARRHIDLRHGTEARTALAYQRGDIGRGLEGVAAVGRAVRDAGVREDFLVPAARLGDQNASRCEAR